MDKKERRFDVMSVHPSVKELLGETRQETGKNLVDITRIDIQKFLLKDFVPTSGLKQTIEYAHVETCTDADPSKIKRYCNKLQTLRTIEQCRTLCPTDSFRWCPTVAVANLHSEIERLTKKTIDQGVFITEQQARIEKLENDKKEYREKMHQQNETIKSLQDKIGSLGDLKDFETMSQELKKAWEQLDSFKELLGDDPIGRIRNLLSIEAQSAQLKEELNRKIGDIATLTKEKSSLLERITRTKETETIERVVPQKDLRTRLEEDLMEAWNTFPRDQRFNLYGLMKEAHKVGLMRKVNLEATDEDINLRFET